jgi:hypothetical protein
MRWNVWIRPTRWAVQAPVAEIRNTFESMGFVIHQQRFDYYNPTRHNRFVVESVHPGAVVLWQLGYANHWSQVRIEIEESDS